MMDWCCEFVERMGSAWPVIGWGLFAGWFIGPYFVLSMPIEALYAVRFGFMAVLLIWWIIDGVDQQVVAWQWVAGFALVAIGQLPYRGATLVLAAWILYWTRVRE